MTYESILFEKKNAIGYVTVNRPKALNALNLSTIEELRSAFTEIRDDASLRAAILTGAGDSWNIAAVRRVRYAHGLLSTTTGR